MLGALFAWALERYRFWPWPAIESMLGAARSISQYGSIVPEGRRVKAPPQAARVRFRFHDPAQMQGGFYAFAGWDEAQGGYVAWLFDASGKRLHTWPINYRDLDRDATASDDGAPHGFDVLPDGSVLVNFDHGRYMARLDACGNPLWKKAGIYHHLMSRSEDGTYWVWRGDDGTPYGHFHYIENFDANTGAKIREVALIEDILTKDPNAPLVLGLRPDVELRRFDGHPDRRTEDDLFHPNDVEPLGAEMAPRFPMFAAGDLLVSIRRLNLVAVIDGKDNRLKWWNHGPWISQHDPDFTDDGFISVYNNNTGRRRSEIVRIDPATRTAVNLPVAPGAEFHSPFMGQHQYLPNGNVLIVAPGEGRVIERSATGELVMEFNNLPAEGSAFNDHVENGIWLPDDFFEALPACGGPSP
jgi:hypothetical protein